MAESVAIEGKAWAVAVFHISKKRPKGGVFRMMPVHMERELIWGNTAKEIEGYIDELAGRHGPFDDRGYVVEEVTFEAAGGQAKVKMMSSGSAFLIGTR